MRNRQVKGECRKKMGMSWKEGENKDVRTKEKRDDEEGERENRKAMKARKIGEGEMEREDEKDMRKEKGKKLK